MIPQKYFPIRKTSDGQANLHIWRIGVSYGRQKGPVYRKEWNNLFFSLLPQPPELEGIVHYADVRKPLNFPDNSFDAIYSFHIIEHLSCKEAKCFLRELCRILKPGGICRVSTPDLEDIVREYLKQMDNAWRDPTAENTLRYHWIKMELYDQLVREKTGGAMSEAIVNKDFDPAYIRQRFGDVWLEFAPSPAAVPVLPGTPGDGSAPKLSLRERVSRLTPRKLWQGLDRRVRAILYQYRLAQVQRSQGDDPRQTFELNKWNYDRLSLRLMMEEAGFSGYQVKRYDQSNIPNWDRYQFDRSNFGDHPFEPSLYAEARKE